MLRIAFVGSVGVPARYGGFETFVQEIGPRLVRRGFDVVVTCDATAYQEHPGSFQGCRLIWIPVRANGMLSVLHDTWALATTCRRADVVLVLGVAGALAFPIARLLSRAKLVVNIDGVEWRRGKFGPIRRALLRLFDAIAQRSCHKIIVDNRALLPYVTARKERTTRVIPYGGDHVRRVEEPCERKCSDETPFALTICRIEPENNIELLISGFLRSRCARYVIVGNWDSSAYGKQLRARYKENPRLRLLEPIYDNDRLSTLRSGCSAYLHGHSVGGTNPSLVEMLYFDCPIFAYDCVFNRETAGEAAEYFSDESQLACLLDGNLGRPPKSFSVRAAKRAEYAWGRIADAYADAVLEVVGVK